MKQYKDSVQAEWLVPVHCFAHRLELVAKDALAEDFDEVHKFLKDVYLHFRNCP